jgi:hypothetical protein
VIFVGTGTIIAWPGEKLAFREVTINSDATISTEDLTIVKRLTLIGKGSLSAVAGDSIVIPNDAVVIEMYAEGKNLPRLSLGEIGGNYNTVPKEFKIELPTGLTDEELTAFSHPLVVGNTLSNCEEWRNRLRLTSSSFRSECVAGSGSRLLSEAKSLMIKGVPAPVPVSATSIPEDVSSLSGGAIAGIVVGTVGGVGSVGALAFVLIRRKKTVVANASP